MLAAAPATAAAQDTQAPVITHTPCRWYSVGAPIVIDVQIDDASPLYDPKVMVQQETRWVRIPLEPNPAGGYHATMPPRAAGPLRYFIEVMDEYGNGPARFGNPEEPVELQPSQSPGACMEETPPGQAPPEPTPSTGGCGGPEPPLYCSAGFWGITGAAVALVGTGVVIYFATRKSNEPRDHGTMTLIVSGPPPTRDGLRGGRR